jgi:hypothetical protein
VRTDGKGRRWAAAVLVAVGLGLDPAEQTAAEPPRGWGVDWVADALWLQVNGAWEAREAAAVRRLGRAVLAAAPDETAFRLGLARMLAHDLPAWREESEPAAPRAVVDAWRRAGLEEALTLLAAGDADDPRLWLEAGGMALHAGGDPARAALFFRRAAERPGAPGHAARVHVRLLLGLGREQEARAWMERLPAAERQSMAAWLEVSEGRRDGEAL